MFHNHIFKMLFLSLLPIPRPLHNLLPCVFRPFPFLTPSSFCHLPCPLPPSLPLPLSPPLFPPASPFPLLFTLSPPPSLCPPSFIPSVPLLLSPFLLPLFPTFPSLPLLPLSLLLLLPLLSHLPPLSTLPSHLPLAFPPPSQQIITLPYHQDKAILQAQAIGRFLKTCLRISSPLSVSHTTLRCTWHSSKNNWKRTLQTFIIRVCGAWQGIMYMYNY